MPLEQDYDQSMQGSLANQYYGGSDFFNYGYWEAGTTTQAEASANLMEKLLAFIPRKEGNILDVACGLGATTRHLLKYYPPTAIVGINISEKQLERARHNAPGCTFRFMDAVRLEFDANSFDNLICVESAFHFNTRDLFLAEAWRVLKPGGFLVMSDILSPKASGRTQARLHRVEANYVPDLATYRQNLEDAGFVNNQVVDASNACWGGFKRSLSRWPKQAYQAGQISRRDYWRARLGFAMVIRSRSQALRYYILVAAQKPQAS